MSKTIRISSCTCGRVQFEAVDAPILSAVCYCDDCQAGGKMIEDLPAASRVLDDDGGASYLTYRDGRFRCISGEALVKGFKLKDQSPTQRYVATCCNSGMYLKYKRGHWVSAYRRRFSEVDLPPVEMRTNTRFRQADTQIKQDAPSYRRFPLRLFTKLIVARLNMALGR